jgi:hypothetical protein
MAGRTYAENRPYVLPDSLGELAGPVTGTVQLPLRLDWSERAVFHLDDPAERNVMYERVIREASQADDLNSYLNEAVFAPGVAAALLAAECPAELGTALP